MPPELRGGLSIWLSLPENFNIDVLIRRMIKHEAAAPVSSLFHAESDTPPTQNGIRFTVTSHCKEGDKNCRHELPLYALR